MATKAKTTTVTAPTIQREWSLSWLRMTHKGIRSTVIFDESNHSIDALLFDSTEKSNDESVKYLTSIRHDIKDLLNVSDEVFDDYIITVMELREAVKNQDRFIND